MDNIMHLVCFSGGHSSALVAIECVRKYGKENVVLINHDLPERSEDEDIKRFKKEVADYLGLKITYANIQGITDVEQLPDQFDVVMEAGAMTDYNGQALCTSRLKTEPFYEYLHINFPPKGDMFHKDCICYYGFDLKEADRIQRRSGILGAMGYKTAFPLAAGGRTIFSTLEIGIVPPTTYSVFEHANCKGCLKASILHWYVVYCLFPAIYNKGILAEIETLFTIHTIIRKGIKRPISLPELAPIFERMKTDGIPATEHQSKLKFTNLIRTKYELEGCDVRKPCECITN